MGDAATPGGGEAHETFATTAREAATDAGAFPRDRFVDGTLDAEYGAGDVKTAADRGAERRVLAVLREAHPDHAVRAEESGHHEATGETGSDYCWVVDALDGTNNFAAGVPTFGVAVTLLDGDGPLVTAVTVPVLEDTYLARRGHGVTYNGRPVTVEDGDRVQPTHATVASVVGAPVLVDDGLADRHREQVRAVRGVCKRVIETWAPVVYWGLLARGRVDGYVTLHPDEREQVAGALSSGEAGCHRRVDGPLTVFARDERTLGGPVGRATLKPTARVPDYSTVRSPLPSPSLSSSHSTSNSTLSSPGLPSPACSRSAFTSNSAVGGGARVTDWSPACSVRASPAARLSATCRR